MVERFGLRGIQIATLDNLLNLSGPQFSYLCDGNDNSTDLTVVGIKRDA